MSEIYSDPVTTRRGALQRIGLATLGLGSAMLLKASRVNASHQKNRSMPWHGYTQAKRNQMILSRAFIDYEYPPKSVGLVCKPWVQRVVLDASKSVVTVPTTTQNSNGGAWEGCPNQDVALRKGQIYSVQPGDIIQMQWKTATKQDSTGGYFIPHTAIVRSVSGSGWNMSMKWLDSNWGQPANNMKVRSHIISLDYFSDMVIEQGLEYNIYMIL